MNQGIDSIKSMEGIDRFWGDEAQGFSQNSLDILIPTIRKPGSELWFSWNPKLKTDPIDAMFRGPHPPPNAIVRRINFGDNPWFSDEMRQDMEWDKRRDTAKYQHIWLGEYLERTDAQVFRNWRIGLESEFEPEKASAFYHGADWGFAEDPTTLVRSYVTGRTIYIDYEAREIGCDIDYTPFLFGGFDDEELKSLNRDAWKKISQKRLPNWTGIPSARKWSIRADSARPETISYMQSHGFPMMVGARKGAGSVEEGVEFLKSYDIVVHPRCVHTISELTHYSYMTDKLTGKVIPKLKDAKNHVIDAIRYSMEEVRSAKIVFMF